MRAADDSVIGGGLAGCEAAWQARAARASTCDLYEMRPHSSGPAHQTDALAELVCSNSLRGAALENAVGLLKEELARLDSLIVTSAREAAVPAGGALAVDRERFARSVESRLLGAPAHHAHARRSDRDSAATVRRSSPAGRCPIDALAAHRLDASRRRSGRLHYYDAASPIVAADSIDESPMYRKSRYDKGDGDDYLNIPLDREQYAQLHRTICARCRGTSPKISSRRRAGKYRTSKAVCRSKRWPSAATTRCASARSSRSACAIRGPARRRYAVVQLRKENADGTALNLVGFQTRLTWPAQKEAFGKLPGLANAEWLRLGVMHRNTFIDSPRLLDAQLALARRTTRSTSRGRSPAPKATSRRPPAARWPVSHAARSAAGLAARRVPARHRARRGRRAPAERRRPHDFQPANVTWAWFSPLDRAGKRRRDKRRAPRARWRQRALARDRCAGQGLAVTASESKRAAETAQCPRG